LNPVKSVNPGYVSGPAKDLIGSVVPTVGFILGLSIFILKNAYLNSKACGDFKDANRFSKLMDYFGKLLFHGKYMTIKNAENVLSVDEDKTKKNPRFNEALIYLIIFYIVRNCRGNGWRHNLQHFEAITSTVLFFILKSNLNITNYNLF